METTLSLTYSWIYKIHFQNYGLAQVEDIFLSQPYQATMGEQ